uniref:Uncharacterized protein n=1 Tax=Noctiluca scintillans TaxID=2966 RepID=A0A7S1F708_NOCSC|mmetsp:Transcript_37454/g.99549  ORF Transcript_37454/g.99549 Transcript_37454/m.99549 type:complete len:297 (+) Transcript_37454:32-922(+)
MARHCVLWTLLVSSSADRVRISVHGPDLDLESLDHAELTAYEEQMIQLGQHPFDDETVKGLLDLEKGLEDGDLTEVDEAATEVKHDIEQLKVLASAGQVSDHATGEVVGQVQPKETSQTRVPEVGGVQPVQEVSGEEAATSPSMVEKPESTTGPVSNQALKVQTDAEKASVKTDETSWPQTLASSDASTLAQHCAMSDETVVLVALQRCLESLSEFSAQLKKQHDISENANAEYVEMYSAAVRTLRKFLDTTAIQAAFQKDNAAAQTALMQRVCNIRQDLQAVGVSVPDATAVPCP